MDSFRLGNSRKSTSRISRSPSPHYRDEGDVIGAIYDDQPETVERLLDSYNNKTIVDTAFKVAASQGNEDVLEVLKQYGMANHNYDVDYGSAIRSAVRHGYFRIAEDLVEFSIWATGEDDLMEMFEGGLISAAADGDIKAVDYYIDRGAGNVYYVNGDRNPNIFDYTSAINAATSHGHDDVANFLINRVALNLYNQALLGAAIGNNINIVELMLTLGADNLNYALHEAHDRGYTKIVNLLLDAGASRFDR